VGREVLEQRIGVEKHRLPGKEVNKGHGSAGGGG
jgi:hypothetical protein